MVEFIRLSLMNNRLIISIQVSLIVSLTAVSSLKRVKVELHKIVLNRKQLELKIYKTLTETAAYQVVHVLPAFLIFNSRRKAT